MIKNVKMKDDFVKEVTLTCTPVEWLIVDKGLKLLSKNKSVNKLDRQMAQEMFDTKPIFMQEERE